MRSLRHRLVALVFAVVACQVAGIAGTPVALGTMLVTDSTGGDEVACTCTHGPNAECPMHEHKKPAPPSRDTRWCTGCHDAADMVLTPIVGFVAPLVDRQGVDAPVGVAASVTAAVDFSLDLARPPASPPPRT
ncbi:MAG: hypothetical protein ABUS56_10975 [Acidobacteriota bacterium]